MEITMARGDLERRSITLKHSDGTPFTTVPDEIYFSVKMNAKDTNVLFQKRFTTGGINQTSENKYQITILPEDTNSMSFGTYDFDIEIVKEGEIKKTFCGVFTLTKEVTHYYNEGV